MLVIDTSAWIEWLMGSPTADTFDKHLPEHRDWIVPTIVQLELVKTLTRHLSDTLASDIIAFTQLCTIAPLDTHIAVAAAEACRTHSLATADAIIFATAQTYDANLLTCDRDFKNLPDVIFVPKT